MSLDLYSYEHESLKPITDSQRCSNQVYNPLC